jgi:hypothetical protein
MHSLSAAVASPWTCPQCRRRVPGREPLCHCGFERARAAALAARAASALPGPSSRAAGERRPVVLGALLFVGVASVLVYAAVRRLDTVAGAPRIVSPLARGEATYPLLPALPAVKSRLRRAAPAVTVTTLAPKPLTAAELDWNRAVALLDLPLRKVAAETSVLEVAYRTFAEVCVAPVGGGTRSPGDRDWLASMKTARLLPGVMLREKGATVGCEGVRNTLVTRADALKADLNASERLAQASGVRPDHWRQLLAVYALDVFDRY